MRVMVVYAHPVETSFNAAIFATVKETLGKSGHELDACDLYAENFPAIMSREDRLLYHDVPANRALARPWIERLEAAEALVMVFPTWVFAPPAILKGFCEKVFLPGVAFKLVDGKVRGAMRHLKRIGGVSTYGGTRWRAFLAGDPPRRLFTRSLRAYVGPGVPISFQGCYDMNRIDETRGKAFLDKLRLAYSDW
ncbi:MAG: NAD(P)H-dependent oxidoreductase [Reyranella sp.]|nr:NAD(P)H-dependent oxidoreductase [Reyranella sp.]MBL6651521.1 NAD(P)H-dependent oxidoreductase [Reyranella sp.]